METTTERTILIIDDDQGEILLTKRVLSKIAPEIRMETALSGEAALALLKNDNPLPALIFLDLKMHGMSGIDILRSIRADARLKQLPVVILTSSLLESDRQESFAAGADDYLHKDFNIAHFSRDIGPLLQRNLKKSITP